MLTISNPSFNISYVAIQLSERDILSAFCSCSSINATAYKLFTIFVVGLKTEIHFRLTEASQIDSDVTS
jgi:hypothetical protein